MCSQRLCCSNGRNSRAATLGRRCFLVVPCVLSKANVMWLSSFSQTGQFWRFSPLTLCVDIKLVGGMQNKLFERFNGSTRIKHEQFEIFIPEKPPSFQAPHLLTYLLHPHPTHHSFRLGIFSRIFRSFIRKHIVARDPSCENGLLLLQIMRRVTSDLLILRVRGVGEHELKIVTMSGRTMAESSEIASLSDIALLSFEWKHSCEWLCGSAFGDQLVLGTAATSSFLLWLSSWMNENKVIVSDIFMKLKLFGRCWRDGRFSERAERPAEGNSFAEVDSLAITFSCVIVFHKTKRFLFTYIFARIQKFCLLTRSRAKTRETRAKVGEKLVPISRVFESKPSRLAFVSRSCEKIANNSRMSRCFECKKSSESSSGSCRTDCESRNPGNLSWNVNYSLARLPSESQ